MFEELFDPAIHTNMPSDPSTAGQYLQVLQKKDILHLLIFDEKIYYLVLERIKWVCNV